MKIGTDREVLILLFKNLHVDTQEIIFNLTNVLELNI